ncbi:Aspartate--tRNA ligase, cytoplasmic [Morella rubra]|uniref:aspartate--tRNA ligase n=1 Tax=Morella rubra TaxID=262757 RepID=A0A6A1UYW0_9ROSI|nr:Aspartate--tRNA ligase, cytoplasmic [Morella rubra]
MSSNESQSPSSGSVPEQPLPPQHQQEEEEDESSKSQSKKAAKKEAAKQEKLRRRQEAALASSGQSLSVEEDDPLSANYGDVPLRELQSKVAADLRDWTEVGALTEALKDQHVLVRGRAQAIRAVGKNMAFLVLRERGFTVQCVVTVQPDAVSRQMVRYAAGLSRESIVDVEGLVSVPSVPIKGATQQVEVQVHKIFCINKAMPTLPINIEDAARSEVEIEKALQIFRQFLLSEGFVEIHTPKLIAGSSEGGAAVFKLDYKGQPACLAQSPQLHKQMAICGDFGRVFEIGPVFRAEDSFTHRHLCEFTGLDVEMEIKKHYFEVMDIVDRLFVTMFDTLNENCAKELEAVGRQYPFEPLKYLRSTLRLTFEEGIQMLKDAGVEVDPLGDLNTETERKLGQLVLEKLLLILIIYVPLGEEIISGAQRVVPEFLTERAQACGIDVKTVSTYIDSFRYGTEFYILHRYPLGIRPFYTMPSYDNPSYSNSFDVFIRGEEIISGAQRVHVPEFLTERAQACGIDVKTVSTYIDSFRYGAPPHGGFGVGLERVVMLFCGLNNIRKTSLFPRDP